MSNKAAESPKPSPLVCTPFRILHTLVFWGTRFCFVARYFQGSSGSSIPPGAHRRLRRVQQRVQAWRMIHQFLYNFPSIQSSTRRSNSSSFTTQLITRESDRGASRLRITCSRGSKPAFGIIQGQSFWFGNGLTSFCGLSRTWSFATTITTFA